MGDKNTIELNGKRYDSLTGVLIDAPKNAAKHAIYKTGASVDGIIGKAHKLKPPRRKTNSRPAHKPQHAKTLMRNAVKKPILKAQAHSQLKTSNGPLASKLAVTLPAAARTMVNERRLALSQRVSKSYLISRFKPIDTTLSKHIKPVEVKKPAPLVVSHPKPDSHRPKPKDDIFTIGLATATSHEQKLETRKNTKRGKHYKLSRNLSILLGVVLIIAIAGIFAAKNLASIELHIAADRSGVHAAVPSYLPAGYKVTTPVKYATDNVTIPFVASGAKAFSLTEQSSGWDSQTLRDSFVAVTDPTYQTIEDQGQTIYVYNHGGATWVNGGIWYQLSSGSGLSDDQIIKLAASL